MRVQRVVLLAAFGCVLALARPFGIAATPDDMTVALERTTALQETARLLRNGATAGASSQVLALEAARLREDLGALVAAHHRWAGALPEARRTTAVAAELAVIEDGCARMRTSLDELDRALAGPSIDRASVQTVGQRIGRQARMCARALRRAQRT